MDADSSSVAPGSQTHAAAAERSDFAAQTPKLWRYHGVCSVGVRLFRSISFLGKAAIVSGVFLAVVAQLAFLFLRSTNQSIEASQRELVGLAYVRKLAPVLVQAQNLRRLLYRSGGKIAPR